MRRKEYVQLLTENATLLADVMSRYRNEEEQRRDFFRRKIAKILPLKMSSKQIKKNNRSCCLIHYLPFIYIYSHR